MGLEDLDKLIASMPRSIEGVESENGDGDLGVMMLDFWSGTPRVVTLPSTDEAARLQRMEAMEFPDEYTLPGEVVEVEALPSFAAHANGVHVEMRCGGVRGMLLPLCVSAAVGAATAALNCLDGELPRLGTPEEPEGGGPVEDLLEIGGYGWFRKPGADMVRRIHLHFHSIATGRGVVIGPLDFWEMREIRDRMARAYGELPPGAFDRSVVKIDWGVKRPVVTRRA